MRAPCSIYGFLHQSGNGSYDRVQQMEKKGACDESIQKLWKLRK